MEQDDNANDSTDEDNNNIFPTSTTTTLHSRLAHNPARLARNPRFPPAVPLGTDHSGSTTGCNAALMIRCAMSNSSCLACIAAVVGEGGGNCAGMTPERVSLARSFDTALALKALEGSSKYPGAKVPA